MSDISLKDETAIQAVLDRSYRAWAAGDAAGMVAAYTADATAIMPGSLREGRHAIRENMALAFAGPLKGTSIYSKQLCLRFAGDGAAIVVSESGILFPGQIDVPDEGKVYATWVLEKQDGSWKIAAYHNSAVEA
ncbi:MAG: hypothetical protein K0R99_4577 [Microbacterium sp.]|uniref:SgcJ/EcaC family oxidoreductase n=1 Tax=Microbacterium sp. TaxID=51671 RepID=UPI0026331F0E|nr:SgcJ/EcaC family oxidoreductase [Microbacterium sp.]MDF2563131.1 hypothetical protein [Microbacterium sp.]